MVVERSGWLSDCGASGDLSCFGCGGSEAAAHQTTPYCKGNLSHSKVLEHSVTSPFLWCEKMGDTKHMLSISFFIQHRYSRCMWSSPRLSSPGPAWRVGGVLKDDPPGGVCVCVCGRTFR